MNHKIVFTGLFVALIGMSSCKKEEIIDEIIDETPTTQSTPPPFPTLSNSDGTLVAIKVQSSQSSPIGPVTMTIGLGVAAFYESNNIDNLIDAGNVNVNSKQLTKQTNNSYVFQPDASNATGVDFSGGVSWNVTGSAAVSAFSFDPSIAFPSAGEITSSEVVNKANGYTLTISSVTDADSVIFQVGSVLKTVPGNTTSCSFSSAELSGLSNGSNVAQVAAYKMENATITGKSYYFINEAVATQTVTIE